VAGREGKNTAALCAEVHGFNLHAGVRCDADQRKQLERLCRYVTRPAITSGRLRESARSAVCRMLLSTVGRFGAMQSISQRTTAIWNR
jgi:hypothetical protein